jgi:L,D-transpeptidase YcbB
MVDLRHTAVVGKIDRQSPQLAVKIQEVNFNPYWTVPTSIIRKDLIPKMQKEPDYLTKNKIRIFTQKGEELQPEQVNWNSMEAMSYRFTQDPGDLNSMGSIRINMPNKDGVYMHDTPSKGLFGENNRFHSSGCVRVQNVRELVDWLLRQTPGWERPQIDAAIRSGKRIDAKLASAVPVHWVYITAWADSEGIVQFRDDIYNMDGVGQLASADMSQMPYDQSYSSQPAGQAH